MFHVIMLFVHVTLGINFLLLISRESRLGWLIVDSVFIVLHMFFTVYHLGNLIYG